MGAKKEYGDFQTPDSLATRVVALVAELFGTPEMVVEPTVGLGAFLKASAERWEEDSEYIGYEINKVYVDLARKSLRQFGVQILQGDFFNEDWRFNIARSAKSRILIIGNPPWVTNSDLGQLGSKNLPQKSNFQGLRGFDARTGKSNFDIAEWMLTRLIEALPSEGAIAMLCKTMTARRVLRHFWKTDGGREGSRLFHIDAKAEFDVAVDACLFFTTGKHSDPRIATVYSDLDTTSAWTRFGFLDGGLVSDIDAYQAHKNLDGGSSTYTWRSGVKHDAAKVMEFTRNGKKLINGLGEPVDIEQDYVFPLLKSSDLGNGRIVIRKAVLVTQRHTGDDTTEIEQKAPRTWEYLMCHKDILDGRKSSIYRNRPRFCVFGIGPYSFAPWKIAISGLYKNMSFVVVPPCDDRPVMVDDTCYFIPCQSKEEAYLLFELLSSEEAKAFLKSLVFVDSKRPITVDVLRRVSFVELARNLGKLDELRNFVYSNSVSEGAETQMSLLM
ncbi:MAG: SAM-dependent methyltransferase [Deltaproteobacteria bacterium]|nr:SAM-dependent methyltransferase [Deltaproteobacteria bacterium]